MNKEEWKAKWDELNEKMKVWGDKAKDSLDTAYLVGLEAKDKAKVALDESKSSMEALKENCRIFSERAKGKASSELLKAQMNMQVAKEEREAKKVAKDREDLKDYIDETVEYAEACVILAQLATEEAKQAKLEAILAQDEYDEKYNN